MVDDSGVTRKEVRTWIHKHPDEMRGISITWHADKAPDDGAHRRLLEILFSPRPSDKAA